MTKHRKIIKKISVWFFTILLVGIVLIFICLAFLSVGPGENLLKTFAEDQLSKTLQSQVQIGKLETNLFFRLSISDLTITKEINKKPVPLLKIKNTRLDYRLFDILHKKISIKNINIDDLFFDIHRDSLGRFNLLPVDSTRATSNDSSKSAIKIDIAALFLRNAFINFDDKRTSINAALFNLNFRAKKAIEESYQLNLSADSLKFSYEKIPLLARQIQLSGNISPEAWRLETLNIDLPNIKIIANGAGNFASIDGAELKIIGRPDQLAAKFHHWIPAPLLPLSGEINISMTAKGDFVNPEIFVSGDLPNIGLGQYQIKNANFKGNLFEKCLELSELKLNIFDGQLSSKGRISLDTLSRNQLALSVSDINLAKLWHTIYREQPPVSGKIDGRIFIQGNGDKLRNWRASAELMLLEMIYLNQQLPDIVSNLNLADGIAAFDFKQANSEIVLNTDLKSGNFSGDFSGHIWKLAPLAQLANIKNLDGEIEFDGQMTGTQQAPEIFSNFLVRNIRYQNFPVDTIIGNMKFQNHQLEFPAVYCSGKLRQIDSTNAPFNLTKIYGDFRYAAAISGPAPALTAEIQIGFDHAGYENFSFDRGYIFARLDTNKIHLLTTNIIRDSLLLHVGGDFYINSMSGNTILNLYSLKSDPATFDIKLEKKKLSFLNLESVGKLSSTFIIADEKNILISADMQAVQLHQIIASISDSLNFGGSLNLTSDFSGSFERPDLNLKFRFLNPYWQNTYLDSLTGSLSFKEDLLVIDQLDLFAQNFTPYLSGQLQVTRNESGQFSISPDNKTSGSFFGSNLNLSTLNSLLPPQQKISGIGDFYISWAGTISSPKLTGNFLLSDGSFKFSNEQPELKNIRTDIVLADSIFKVNSVEAIFQDVPIKLQGKIITNQWQEAKLDLRLNVSNSVTAFTIGNIKQDSLQIETQIKELNLSLLQPFISNVNQLAGNLSTKILVKGKTSDPDIIGNLKVQNLSMQLPDIFSNLNQGLIKVTFDNKNVQLDSIFAKLNDGTIFINGYLNHELGELADLNLSANFEKIKIDRPKEFLINIKSSKLNYQKKENYFALDGDIILGETKLLYDLKPQAFVNFARSVERPKPEQPDILKMTKFNIRLRESENVWVDNNLARVKLHPEISFIGTPANPNLGGRLSITEGYVLYLDRKFKITEGIIDFIDPNRMNPIIDLQATASLKNYQTMVGTPYEITLRISGMLDQTVITLSSDPALDQADILTLLTFGATRRQLTSSSADGKDHTATQILLERAKTLSSEQISGFASRKLGNLFGLEQITIEGNLFKFGKAWNPQLLASKKISDRVELIYTTTVGHMNEQNIRLEYLLTKKFSIEGQTDQQGRSGIDLKYKLKFK